MRARFDASLIADLKRLVVDHNEAHPDAAHVKLGDLRKIYERGFRRSNPGQRAMDRVAEHLAQLAKAGDNFDEQKHPRATDGEFSHGAAAALPASPDQHKALQTGNAGYRALTSDVIPDNRHEAIGAGLRDVGSLAAGAGAVAALASNKKGGFAERAAAKVGGTVAGVAAGAGATIGANMTRAASLAANRVVRRSPVLSTDGVTRIRRAGRDAGEAMGGAVGRYTARGASAVVQGAFNTVGNGLPTRASERHGQRVATRLAAKGFSPPEVTAGAARAAARVDRRVKFGRKAALFGLLAGGAGLAIRSQIKDTAFDPANIGRSIDAFSYRTIEKVAASADLEAARQQLVSGLAKDMGHAGSIESLSAWLATGGGEGLQKAAFARWGSAFTGLATAGAAAIGGALGAGATHVADSIGQHKGNPYRDEHGRFTSRDQAVGGIGGLLGGAAAGIAVYAALRRHNIRAFEAIHADRLARVDRVAALVDKGQSRRAKALLDRAAFHETTIKEEHKDLKGLRDKLAAIEKHGASAHAPLQERLEAAYHHHIAGKLAALADHVDMPDGRSLAQAVRPSGSAARTLELRGDAVHKVLRSGDSKAVAKMVSRFPDTEKKAVTDLYAEGQQAVANVPDVIASHQAKIDAAAEAVDAAKKAHKAASDAYAAADIKAKLADAPNAEAAKAELDAASAARDSADAQVEKLTATHRRLVDNPKGVFFRDKPIRPPTHQEIEGQKDDIRRQMTTKAREVFAGHVEGAKAADREDIARRRDRIQAAQAIKDLRYTLPGHAKASVKALADTEIKLRDATDAVSSAKLDHAPNERDMQDLVAARRGTTGAPKGMKLERARDVRGRAAAIETSHAKTAKALADAEATLHATAAEHVQHASVMRQALAATTPKSNDSRQRGQGFLPPQLRRDLTRAKDSVGGAMGDFLKQPGAARLRAAAAELKPKVQSYAANQAQRAKNAGKAIVQEAFTMPTVSADGKQGRRFSIRSTGAVVAGAPIVLGSAVQYGRHLQDLASKDKDKRSAAWSKLKNGTLRVEHTTDPITGAGYTAVTAPDPTNKGERILVWGEGQVSDKSSPFVLRPNSKMSDVRTKMRSAIDTASQRQQQATGSGGSADMRNPDLVLSEEHKKAVDAALQKLGTENKLRSVGTVATMPALRVRADDDQAAGSAAGHVIAAVREKVGAGKLSGGKLHAALAGLFSRQGQVLQAKQAYRFITGQNEDGTDNEKYKGVLSNTAGFGDSDKTKVAAALSREVDGLVANSKPSNLAEKANLHRLVALVGDVRKLSPEQLKPAHDKIAALQVAQRADASAADKPRSNLPAVIEPPAIDVSRPISAEGRQEQKRQPEALKSKATSIASDIGPKIGLGRPHEIDGLAAQIESVAMQVRDGTKLSVNDAFDVARSAFDGAIQARERDPSVVSAMLASDEGPLGNREFLGRLQRAIMQKKRENQVEKAILLDDIDALMKMSFGDFTESLHPRAASGSSAGGEFVSGGAGEATGAAAAGGHGVQSPEARVASETTEGAAKQVGGGGERAPRTQAWNHPVRLGNELGGALGYESAFTIAQNLLPASVRGVARFAGEIGAGMAGSYLGGEAGNRAGQSYLHAQGKKGAEYAPPPERGLGETGASIVGSTAAAYGGQVAGGAVGTTAGRWIGGALGSLAGPEGTVGGAVAGGIAGKYIGRVVGGALGGYAGDLGARAAYGHAADAIGQQPTDKALAGGAAAGAAAYGTIKAAPKVAGIARHFAGYDTTAVNTALSRFTRGLRA